MGRPGAENKAIRENVERGFDIFCRKAVCPRYAETSGKEWVSNYTKRKFDDGITTRLSVAHLGLPIVVVPSRTYATGATGAATGATPRSTPSVARSPLVAFWGPENS